MDAQDLRARKVGFYKVFEGSETFDRGKRQPHRVDAGKRTCAVGLLACCVMAGRRRGAFCAPRDLGEGG